VTRGTGDLARVTVFLGCGFAAKYREGGGVLSVPLQWMLGLRRLSLDAIWLEIFPGTGNEQADQGAIRSFQAQLRAHGLAKRYCLLYQPRPNDSHHLKQMHCSGISREDLLNRLAGPNTLLNLSYSVHPPLLLEFERRIFCDLDPSEIFYWMTKMEMGQSYHHEFWTIGLNVNRDDCQLPKAAVAAPLSRGDPPNARNSRRQSAVASTPAIIWKTFYPLVDTKFFQPRARPREPKFTTVGQWYWGGAVEVAGEFPDLSKRFAFRPYLDLPARVPEARFELAMNIAADDPERDRLRRLGWKIVDPHRVARTPGAYRRYLASALAEFTAIKGVDVAWRTGWISDRAAAFLALGRPVITEDTGADLYLPEKSGFRFIRTAKEADTAVREVLCDWPQLSKQARQCAVDVFDSAKTLRRILDF